MMSFDEIPDEDDEKVYIFGRGRVFSASVKTLEIQTFFNSFGNELPCGQGCALSGAGADDPDLLLAYPVTPGGARAHGGVPGAGLPNPPYPVLRARNACQIVFRSVANPASMACVGTNDGAWTPSKLLGVPFNPLCERQLVASAHSRPNLCFWDASTGECVNTFELRDRSYSSMAFTAWDGRVWTLAHGGALAGFDVHSQKTTTPEDSSRRMIVGTHDWGCQDCCGLASSSSSFGHRMWNMNGGGPDSRLIYAALGTRGIAVFSPHEVDSSRPVMSMDCRFSGVNRHSRNNRIVDVCYCSCSGGGSSAFSSQPILMGLSGAGMSLFDFRRPERALSSSFRIFPPGVGSVCLSGSQIAQVGRDTFVVVGARLQFARFSLGSIGMGESDSDDDTDDDSDASHKILVNQDADAGSLSGVCSEFEMRQSFLARGVCCGWEIGGDGEDLEERIAFCMMRVIDDADATASQRGWCRVVVGEGAFCKTTFWVLVALLKQ